MFRHDPASAYEYGRPGRERLPKMTLLNHQSIMNGLFGPPAIDVKTIGILVYDGVDHVTIEDNVIDLVNGRFGIELYSDNGSIIRHNTLRYATTCEYVACGQIILDHKSADPAGRGTVIVDNIATAIWMNNGSTAARVEGNMVCEGPGAGNFLGAPLYAGGAVPTTLLGFKLAAGSPGQARATDGLDVGIRRP